MKPKYSPCSDKPLPPSTTTFTILTPCASPQGKQKLHNFHQTLHSPKGQICWYLLWLGCPLFILQHLWHVVVVVGQVLQDLLDRHLGEDVLCGDPPDATLLPVGALQGDVGVQVEVPGGLEELPGRRHPVGPEDPGLGRQLPLGNKSGGGRGSVFLIAFGLVRLLSLLKWD